MSEPSPASADAEEVRRRVDRERRRREVFGDVLDGATLDDRPEPPRAGSSDPGAGRAGRAVAAEDRESERWLRENVPPHHGS